MTSTSLLRAGTLAALMFLAGCGVPFVPLI